MSSTVHIIIQRLLLYYDGVYAIIDATQDVYKRQVQGVIKKRNKKD